MKIDILADLTKKNILSWTNELWVFLRCPSKFITDIFKKTDEEVFSQYVFYFVVFTFSNILNSSTSDFNTLLRPSLIDWVVFLPVSIILTFSFWLVTRENYFKKTLVFTFTLYLIYSPIYLTLNIIYVLTNNSIVFLIGSLLKVIFTIYLLYGISFVLLKGPKRKIIGMTSVIFTVGILYFFATLFLSKLNIPEVVLKIQNPVYEEYDDLVSQFNHLEIIPMKSSVTKDNHFIFDFYSIQVERGASSYLTVSPDSLKYYKKIINQNLKYLEGNLNKVHFELNKQVVKVYLDYYNFLDRTFLQDSFKMDRNNFEKFMFYEKNSDTLNLKRNLTIDLKNLSVGAQIKDVNNSLIKIQVLNLYLEEFQNLSIFVVGRLIDLVINPSGVEMIKKEKFLKKSDFDNL